MGSLLLARVLVCLLAVGRGTGGRVTADPNLRRVSEQMDVCPQCDTIFTMLETETSGARVQHIDVVERGKDIIVSWSGPSYSMLFIFDALLVIVCHCVYKLRAHEKVVWQIDCLTRPTPRLQRVRCRRCSTTLAFIRFTQFGWLYFLCKIFPGPRQV